MMGLSLTLILLMSVQCQLNGTNVAVENSVRTIEFDGLGTVSANVPRRQDQSYIDSLLGHNIVSEYVVRFEANQWVIVDSLMSMTGAKLCDSATIGTLWLPNLLKEDCWRFTLRKIGDHEREDTLFLDYSRGSSALTFRDVRYFDFRLGDSVLAISGIAFGGDNPGISNGFCTAVLRRESTREVDTLGIVPGGRDCKLARSGPEVFIREVTCSQDWICKSRALIYDIVTRQVLEPFPDNQEIVLLYRPSPDYPLFAQVIDTTTHTNIWLCNSTGPEVKLTSFSDALIEDWTVLDDELRCITIRDSVRSYHALPWRKSNE